MWVCRWLEGLVGGWLQQASTPQQGRESTAHALPCRRDMAKLAPFNAAGVTAVSLLAVCVAALGATTLATGAAYMVRPCPRVLPACVVPSPLA